MNTIKVLDHQRVDEYNVTFAGERYVLRQYHEGNTFENVWLHGDNFTPVGPDLSRTLQEAFDKLEQA